MATITGGMVAATLLTALAGGLDKPDSNWSEIDLRQPAAQVSQMLDQRGNIVTGAATPVRKKISPADYFRIVELAPKAILSPDALKSPPEGAGTLLHIKTGDGQDYYFASMQERFKDSSAQEIWDILRHYRN